MNLRQHLIDTGVLRPASDARDLSEAERAYYYRIDGEPLTMMRRLWLAPGDLERWGETTARQLGGVVLVSNDRRGGNVVRRFAPPVEA